MRPLWAGSISFGLVNIPVRLYPATRSREISLKMVHRADGGPIHYKTVCEVDDREIPREEIGKGFEIAPGQIVLLEPDEIEAIQERITPRAIEILDFVEIKEVDPIYFQKAYYVGAQQGAAKAYSLLTESLKKTGKAAVARFGMRAKTHLAILRPVGDVLTLETMFYQDEVQNPTAVPVPVDVEVSDREVQLAEMLIQNLSRKWEPGRYRDETRTRLEELIEKKREGQVITAPTRKEEGKVIDLLAALEASLGKGAGQVFEAAEPEEPRPKPRARKRKA